MNTTTGTELIPSATVRQFCGGISDMTLWRWLSDPKMGFPKPIVIQRRRYWRLADIEAWIAERATAA